ncbi:hypothetical protein NLI96_g9033 [Meripilus lineatus]|uniref:Transcription factor TFIIIC triple barrel domain-containing protein n=1 Tax=Meripilus lineatus TaxID=2056292 RepID=A0AAD5UW73_9APHY|nr:hypothetical protein NLI96_g9033 [Physisporinus lineatus]
MSRQSLFPGFSQVEAFGQEEEYEHLENGEVDEEVVYVTLDLGQVEPTLVPSTSSYRLIGLDTPTPYLQLSGSIFKGQHQNLLGTEILFTESRDEHHNRNTKPPLSHVAITEHRIRFKEVEVKPLDPVALGDASKQQKESLTAEQLDGSSALFAIGQTARGSQVSKRGRGSRAKPKGKGKAIEVAPDDPMDVDSNLGKQ